jgi:hypothetical protein
MTLQKCPKCGSSRIRRGYKRTPLPMRLIGIYHLLCDHCNLLFTGFVLPGTLRSHRRKKHKGDKKSDEGKEFGVSTSSNAR